MSYLCLSRAHQPNSHAKYGWQTFTDAIIRLVSETQQGVVFILWGGFAHKKEKLVDQKKHAVIKTAHPSPLSFGKFINCKCFSNANKELKKFKKTPVDWTLWKPGFPPFNQRESHRLNCSVLVTPLLQKEVPLPFFFFFDNTWKFATLKQVNNLLIFKKIWLHVSSFNLLAESCLDCDDNYAVMTFVLLSLYLLFIYMFYFNKFYFLFTMSNCIACSMCM